MTMTAELQEQEQTTASVVEQIAEAIRSRDTFVIAGHLRPDGDCLGSCLGLYAVLRGMGKSVRFYTAGPIPEHFNYLPNFDVIETEVPKELPDAYIYVDSGDPERVNEDFKPTGFVINIDHHLSNSRFGVLNWVDIEATAAAEQIFYLALALDQPITRDIATCIFTGLMTDTGGFRFSNTDYTTFQIAGELVRLGAKPAEIAGAVYESRTREAVYLTGEVYSHLHFELDGKLVWAEITDELFKKVGGDKNEPEGLASDIRGIEGVEVSVLFFETPEHQCRLGLRSKGTVNVSELATMLGGGGHHNASGAFIRDDYNAAREQALKVVRPYIAKSLGLK